MNVLKQMPNRSGPDVFFSFPGVKGSVSETSLVVMLLLLLLEFLNTPPGYSDIITYSAKTC